MKGLLVTAIILWPLAPLRSEEAVTKWDVEIPDPISDGTPSPPAPERVPLDFEVERGITRRVHVVESPEMSGLPPITGTINVTVELVKDPGLPDPPPPLPALPPDDPAVITRMAELRENYRATQNCSACFPLPESLDSM